MLRRCCEESPVPAQAVLQLRAPAMSRKDDASGLLSVIVPIAIEPGADEDQIGKRGQTKGL
ncbi:hypothetical protein IEO21_10189 [Rhodonia placenta]|uniref:Uncharacterized protein n=2 Tax=Rhodonia placenta TaxID=104341 RepID=A0A1X6MJ97_9APHY|nr:hypothetical protein POSPLADRAFT_1062958 [Postia placenta MAD-698-R-SB12]KAF9801180.1 hypothetical protein IEO21_10189 [Postia placenta]OSX56113.1 hypothetical protein POSPLADRAFT_1062958 [Postia placenta MAD-698-R-SB12]